MAVAVASLSNNSTVSSVMFVDKEPLMMSPSCFYKIESKPV